MAPFWCTSLNFIMMHPPHPHPHYFRQSSGWIEAARTPGRHTEAPREVDIGLRLQGKPWSLAICPSLQVSVHAGCRSSWNKSIDELFIRNELIWWYGTLPSPLQPPYPPSYIIQSSTATIQGGKPCMGRVEQLKIKESSNSLFTIKGDTLADQGKLILLGCSCIGASTINILSSITNAKAVLKGLTPN